MATTNTDFLPNTTGLNLGSPDQAWDGFFDNINAAGDVIVEGDIISNGGVTIATGNATKLQGNPIAPGLPLLNQALIWNGLAWAPANQSGGGGGGATLGYVAVGYSATPVFTASPVGSCTFAMTLTGNVTSSTFTTTGITPGCIFNFSLKQDGPGGHTFVWPALALGTQPIATDPNTTTVQNFFYDGTNLIATGFPAVF